MNDLDANPLDQLRAANPVDVEQLRRDLGEVGLAEARQRVAARVEHGSAKGFGSMRSPRLRLAAAATIVATALAAVLAALPAREDSTGGPGPLAAAAALAAGQPSTVPGPGQYSYLKLRSRTTSEPGGSDTEWWVAADRSGRMVESMTGLVTGETPVGRGWRQTGPGNWLNNRRFGPGHFAGLYGREAPGVVDFDIERLPTGTRKLRAVLQRTLRRAAHDSDPESGFAPVPGSIAEQAQMLVLIGQILAHPLASPPLRSALYTVAGGLPGVKVREDVVDPIGRRGTALSFAERLGQTTNRHEVIFDPATSETLATQLVSAEPQPRPQSTPSQPPQLPLPTPVPPGQRDELAQTKRLARKKSFRIPPQDLVMGHFTDYTVYLARGIVDSLEDRP